MALSKLITFNQLTKSVEAIKAYVDLNSSDVADIIAPIETSTTASQTYTEGSLFVYNGDLYIVTQQINEGGTIVPGTNCIATTIEELIDSLIEEKQDKIEEVTVSTSGDVSQALDPEKIYHFTSSSLTSLTITLNNVSGKLAQYHFDVVSSSGSTSLILPNSIKIDLDGTEGSTTTTYSLEANTRYEIDILNNYGVVSQWEMN